MTAFASSILLGINFYSIVKQQTNDAVNKKMNEYRELGGNKIIEIGGSLRKMYSLIKNNEIICFLMDQSAHSDYSIYADFFGQKTATFAGPAKMALKFRTELVFVYGYRKDDYSYLIRTEKIDYEDITGMSDENITELTGRINLMIEKYVTAYSDQWLWMHRRFKHVRK